MTEYATLDWDNDEILRRSSELDVRVEKMLADYQQPPLGADIVEALAEYIAKKKSSMRDSFI